MLIFIFHCCFQVIPVGDMGGSQVLHQVDKAADGSCSSQELMSVRYVPLVPPPSTH